MITVNFPLIGEWEVVTSPVDHVPSHYTHSLGMTYAFDFVKTKDNKIPLMSRLVGQDITLCEGWNAEVIAPIDGEIVEIKNNIPDRNICLFSDLYSGLYAIKSHNNIDHLGKIFGNYIIIKGDKCCCLLAHLKKGSISVSQGNNVKAGELVGNIGHSGSSQMPHLHFQLMNSSNLLEARGIEVNFNIIKKDKQGQWSESMAHVPSRREVIRSANKPIQPTANSAAD